MKKIFVLFILLYSLISFNSAIASDNKIDTTNKKIQLGVIVPLTGPLAFFGKDFVKTYELAVEDMPEIKDVIDVHWEDSAYESKQAVSVFNKLVSIDKVDVVLSFGGPMLSALAPLAEMKKVPFFATESEKKDCQGKLFCSLFRNEEDEWGKATWQVLRKQGRKKIGIVKNQNQFMNTFVNALVRNKNENETVEIVLDALPNAVDLRSSLLALKAKEFDALGVYLLPDSHLAFLNAMRTMNKTFPLFGVEEFLVKEHNKGFENITNGALVICPGSLESYRAKFESKYGESAGFFYTPAFYDFFVLLKEVVSSNKELRGQDLIQAMHFNGERTGVSGKYKVKVSKEGVYSYSFPIAIYKMIGDSVMVEEVVRF